MKKKMVIELMIYIVIVIVGVIMLFVYQPREMKIILPQDFRLEKGGGVEDVVIPSE